jgi:murein DD-endopeptidase MepM/ murein hydrolase activator NlpD
MGSSFIQTNNLGNETQMKKASIFNLRLSIIIPGILVLLVTACSTPYPETCPASTPIGLENANEIASDDNLPFRFPLDESPIDNQLYYGWFGVSNECTPDVVGGCYEYPERKFHAAEDYKRPAGTPVYAMADGTISFSRPAGGYGWLILIDHPQANLYSLYGHLSPSRWKLKNGTDVARGDLIAYLGDSDENGGSKEQPVDTHLHFGIRAGQTTDYPAKGEWRYMGGWIKLCPQDVGWLQPSLVITNQEIPVGGYPQPEMDFLTRWGLELLITSLYMIGGVLFIVTNRKKTRFILLIPGFIAIVAGFVFQNRGVVRSNLLLVIGILILAVGIHYFIRQPVPQQQDR